MSQLPIITLPNTERWDCQQCDVCCCGTIHVTTEEAERIQSQAWQRRPEFGIDRTIAGSPGELRLAQKPDGTCVFLLPSKRCAIHQELGADAKPLVCRMFPLQLIAHEKQAVLTLRRACPTAAVDSGRPLSEHLPGFRTLAEQENFSTAGVVAPPFKAGESPEWKRTRPVLEALRRITNNEHYPPIHRLVQGLVFCRLLEQAKTTEFTNQKLVELVCVLEENVAEETQVYFGERALPSASTRLLLRQMALEMLRLHPTYHTTPSWSTRFSMFWWAWKMLRGKGALPQVHPTFPAGMFEQLEMPLGRLNAAVYQPLFRYFETTTSSGQYALANKREWSVIESYRQLAIFYPLALWLLRWQTLGREAQPEDMRDIVCMLDRAQGHAPLVGANQRARLQRLVELEALPSLLTWYGR